MAGLGGAFAVAAAVVGIVLVTGGGDGNTPTAPDPSASASAAATGAAGNSPAATTTGQPAGAVPTATPTAPPPTATPTPEGGFANITAIRVVDGRYAADFFTSGFSYSLPGTHVHFFFDTTPVEQAGSPGRGPWAVYGGGSPFQDLGPSDRPTGATQLCVLVANPDHSIRPGTGNCASLPN